jgi:hypothetical protein
VVLPNWLPGGFSPAKRGGGAQQLHASEASGGCAGQTGGRRRPIRCAGGGVGGFKCSRASASTNGWDAAELGQLLPAVNRQRVRAAKPASNLCEWRAADSLPCESWRCRSLLSNAARAWPRLVSSIASAAGRLPPGEAWRVTLPYPLAGCLSLAGPAAKRWRGWGCVIPYFVGPCWRSGRAKKSRRVMVGGGYQGGASEPTTGVCSGFSGGF